jgi:N-acetylneuraminic acid mutarotase
MKRSTQILLISIVAFLYGCQKPTADVLPEVTLKADTTKKASTLGQWTRKKDYPGGNTEGPVGFAIGDKLYAGITNGAFDFWEFNPAANTWTSKRTGPGRNGMVFFSIGAYGYAGLGSLFLSSPPTFSRYDPALDTWTSIADFPGQTGSDATGFSIGNKGYVLSGNSNDTGTKFYEYDPATNLWTQKADFPVAEVKKAVGFSIGTKGYAGTGFALFPAESRFNVIKEFWEYDPSHDEWTRKADFGGGPRWLAAAFSFNNKGYIGTGASDRGGTATLKEKCDFWEYNPSKDKWTLKASLPGGVRYSAIGLSICNKGYLGLGTATGTNAPLLKRDFWEFDPSK